MNQKKANTDKAMSNSQCAMKAVYEILETRQGQHISEEIAEARKVVYKIHVSIQDVMSAMRIWETDQSLAESVMNGNINLSDALEEVKEKEDTNINYMNTDPVAAVKYKEYKALSKQELARRLVELELK